jgi:hypothetical protein
MQSISRGRQLRFLAALAKGGDVDGAATNAHLDRARLEEARTRDRVFAGEWKAAENAATQRLEHEAWRRAVHGVPEPLISEGKVIRDDDGRPLSIQRYSDTILIELLRTSRARKFAGRFFFKALLGSHLVRRLATILLIGFAALAIGSVAFQWMQAHILIWAFH